VRRSLGLLRAEVERAMALLGAPSIAQIEARHVAGSPSLRQRRAES